MTISAKSFSILAFGQEEKAFNVSYIGMGISETGNPQGGNVLSTDQIGFSYVCRRSPSDHFHQSILNSDEWFQE